MTETTEGLEACLPTELQGPETTITRIAAGASGAGVYRVDAGGRAFVLKVTGAEAPPADWQRALHVRRLAAAAGVAPQVVHVDEARRAVVSAFVADRSFAALYFDPRRRTEAIALLGRTLGRVHALPLPATAAADALAGLGAAWAQLRARGAAPAFVADAVARLLGEAPPPRDRDLVLCHNDVNPTNLVYDGEALLLLDWEAAAPNDPLYDLATLAMFLRMDEATSRALLAAYDGRDVDALPARFTWSRRLVAALCGVIFLGLARGRGHDGGGDETLDATSGLGEVYQRLRAGTLDVGSVAGQWQFGLALVKESLAS